MRKGSCGRSRGGAAAALVLVLVLAALAAAAEQPPPAEPAGGAAPVPLPDRVWLEDTPNDDGRQLTLRWRGGDGAAAEGVLLQPQLATGPDGPWFDAGSPAPARGAWYRDLEPVYGIFIRLGDDGGHGVVLKPLEVAPFAPARLVRLMLEPAPRPEALAELEQLLGKQTLAAIRQVLRDWEVGEPDDLAGHVEAKVMRAVERLVLGRPWYARLVASRDGGTLGTVAAEAPLQPAENLFDRRKVNNLAFALVFSALVLLLIRRARRDPDLYLRRLAGLDAVDEAVGRATEMGKPVLFVHGLNPMDSVSTIAAVNILGEIAKRVAQFDSRLLVTNYDPIVLAVSQETVREGFTHAGRPDAYSDDDVFLAASEQFAYVAAVDGIMVRQRPAANLYVGYFYAESLLLAETGATTGAIQIAATDSFTQLPFFVTTCDYTLMGEELYAASAYLSRDPLLLGSIKGQDWGKAILIVLLVAGAALAALDATWLIEPLIKVY
ncbi:MAG: hypothetical protein KatS3mg102_2795 [Planctomycetota bacterium]|nr:MAG: hypothetical protein KatS3mg102_2795 [Planctomycetota bacterium]